MRLWLNRFSKRKHETEKVPGVPIAEKVSRLRKTFLSIQAAYCTLLTKLLALKSVELIASLALLITFLPITLYYHTRRGIVTLIAKQTFGWSTRLLDNMDYVFSLNAFAMDPASVLTTVLKLDGEVTLDALRHRVKTNLTHKERWDGSWQHPKLRIGFQKFMGYVVGVKEDVFDVNKHVDYLWDDATGMKIFCCSEKEISDLVDNLSSKPLLETKEVFSPWKIYLINCKTPSQSSTFIIIRSSHALCDGVSLVGVFIDGLVDNGVGKLCLNTIKEKSVIQRSWREIKGVLRACGNFAKHALLDKADTSPFVQYRPVVEDKNAMVLRRKFTTFPTIIPLQVFEEISKVTHVKINTIVIWAYLRSLQRFSDKLALSAVLALSGKRKTSLTSFQVDKNRRQWTFNLGEPVCMWQRSKLHLENRISFVRRSFAGHDLAGETWDTLRKVQRSLETGRFSQDVWGFYAGIKYFFAALPLGMLGSMKKLLGPKFSVLSTNVRGAEGEQKVLRQRIEWATIFVPLFEGVDVGLAAGSYNGNMTISIAALKGAVQGRDDIQELQDCMEEEILNLHHSLTTTSIHVDDIRHFFTLPSKV